MTLARDMGMEVEQRHILLEELADVTEAAACGTAAVASPVAEIDDLDTGHKYVILPDRKPGPVVTALYDRLRGYTTWRIPRRTWLEHRPLTPSSTNTIPRAHACGIFPICSMPCR